MKPLRIVFTGFFGAGNLGDEAILLSEVRGLFLRCPGSTYVVASFNPDYHRALGLEAFEARDTDALGKALSEADLHVLGGGGLWQDYWGWNPGDLFAAEPLNIAFYARGLLAASAVGVPSVLFANGVGPLRYDSARRAVASLASLAAGVSVRDKESAEILRAGGFLGPITTASDPAFAIAPVADGVQPRRRSIRIGVVPRFWSHGANGDDLLSAVGDAVGTVAAERNAEVVLLRFQRPNNASAEDDARAIEAVIGAMPAPLDAKYVIDPVTPEEAAGWLASCDVAITMRLHGAIFAAVGSVPSVALGLDPKLVSNARRLGLSDLVAPLDSCSSALLQDLIGKALGARDRLEAGCRAGVDAARMLLDSAFDSAIDCIAPPETTKFVQLEKGAFESLSAELDKTHARTVELSKQVQEREVQLAEQTRSIESLSAELDKNRATEVELAKQVQQKDVQLAEQKGTIESLSTELARNRGSMAELAKEVQEREQAVRYHTAQLEERGEMIRIRDERIEWLKGEAAEARNNLDRLSASNHLLSTELVSYQNARRKLAAQLQETGEELRRIKGSVGWRLLSRYGRFKYRYLLPVYRLFGLGPPPSNPAAENSEVASVMPQAPVSEDGASEVASPGSSGDGYFTVQQ